MPPKLLLALLGTSSTALAQTYAPPGLGYFVLNAIAPTNDSAVTIDPINASGGKFWVRPPKSQPPLLSPASLTPPSTSSENQPPKTCTTLPQACAHLALSTVLSTTINSLDPSGTSPPTPITLATLSGYNAQVQHIFIAADDTLSYTPPGAAVPADAQASDAFVYAPEPRRTEYGTVAVEGRDWWACIEDPARDVWQISSVVAGTAPRDGCYTIQVLTRPYWQGVNIDYYNTES